MIKIIAMMLCLIYTSYGAYIFYKGNKENPQPLQVDEFEATQAVLKRTEFTHLLDKERNEKLTDQEAATLEKHFNEQNSPFYETALIQESLGDGLFVCYVPDTIAQLILVNKGKKLYFTQEGEIKPEFAYTPPSFQNDLNSVVLNEIKDKPFFATFEKSALSQDDVLKQHEADFKKVIQDNISDDLYLGVSTKDDVKSFLLRMIKAEILSKYELSLLMVRSSYIFNKNGAELFDNVYKDDESYGQSYNYSLFAAYFFDPRASTYKIGIRGANWVLYTLSIPKKNRELFKLFYLPEHQSLNVIFEMQNDFFHPRTYGRTSAGSPRYAIVRSQTPVTQHDIHLKAYEDAYWNGYNQDISRLSEEEKKEYYNTFDLDRIEELENKMSGFSPSKIAKYDKAQFKDVDFVDMSKLTPEEQHEYEKLKSKVALTLDEQAKLQKFGKKTTVRSENNPLTLEGMRRKFDYTQQVPDADKTIKNDDKVTLPLMDLITNHSIIIAIDGKAVESNIGFPVRYADQKAQELTKNMQGLYRYYKKISTQKDYARHLQKTGRTDNEKVFAASEKDYIEGKINALQMQISTIDRVIKRSKEDQNDDEKSQRYIKSLEDEKENLLKEKENLTNQLS